MGDLIDRDEAIKAIRKATHADSDIMSDMLCGGIAKVLMGLPAVQPQQAIRAAYKHGKSKGIKRGMAIARRKHEEQST